VAVHRCLQGIKIKAKTSGILISEIQELARLNLMTFNVNVVSRICNMVTHVLVAPGYETSEEDIMVVDIVLSCMSNEIYFRVKRKTLILSQIIQ
jgi:hypothetical protein